MDMQAQWDLQLLNAVEQDAEITQRSLADKLGVVLGLTNLYLKRLARKGYIKIAPSRDIASSTCSRPKDWPKRPA
jgi:Mn-dependent DtxR family transcriptional regulator